MAEALTNAHWGNRWQAYSAGTRPAGYVHPLALEALADAGIHHQGDSKHVDQIRTIDFDLVVTVCDSAAEDCPVWLGKGQRLHHSFRDPATAQGSPDEVLQVFKQVRDEIKAFLGELVGE